MESYRFMKMTQEIELGNIKRIKIDMRAEWVYVPYVLIPGTVYLSQL